MPWPDIFFRPKPPRQPVTEPMVTAEEEPVRNSAIESEASVADSAQRLPVSQVALPPAPVHSVSSDVSVMKDMAEADTLRELSRSGGVRLIKRDFQVTGKADGEEGLATPTSPGAEGTVNEAAAGPALGAAGTAEVSIPAAEKKPEAGVGGTRLAPAINLSGTREPAASGVYPAAMTIFRRRTKMTDVARIVLPPRRDESGPLPSAGGPPGVPRPVMPPANAVPASSESAAIVIPPSFPVAMATRVERMTEARGLEKEPVISKPEEVADRTEGTGAVDAVIEEKPSTATNDGKEEAEKASPEIPAEVMKTAVSDLAGEKGAAPAQAKEETISSTLGTLAAPEEKEKREFVLTNGERILGRVLSETGDSIYIDHGTLGVLTIPRAQIAQRPVEIILINGDRVVGDIIAETADSLFVRHASLGILTVPRSQRSTRVVEAILKDGDRILGEVLGETENFTVIRSATLGTVAVPHNKVAMLNRRAEQVEMRALPGPLPALENKPAGQS